MTDVLVPIALSSGIDQAGEERLHAARFTTVSKPAWQCALPSVSGNLPNGRLDDEIEYQYTLIQTEAGQPVTVSITAGALPDGLSMDSSGLVTGTATSSGSYSWEITPTSACGDGTPISDSADIVADVFWLTTNNSTGTNKDSVWQSEDLDIWTGPTLRVPAVATPFFGPINLGTNRVLIAGTQNTLELITDLNPAGGYATTTVPLVTMINRFRRFGNIVVAIKYGSLTYYTSADSGATWTARTAPGSGTGLRDVARLNSGRWIAFVADNASSRFLYSDQTGEPTTWINSTATPASSMSIACNGVTAIGMNWNGGVVITTTGTSWDPVAIPNVTGGDLGVALALDSTFLLSCSTSTYGNSLVKTHDSGVNWTAMSFPQCIRLEKARNLIVASLASVNGSGNTGALYSADLGDVWNDVTMPYSTSDGDRVTIASVTYLP